MTTIDDKCLDIFPHWLNALGDDLLLLLGVVEVKQLPVEARQALVGAMNYVFKSLDLVPDGIDEIGYLDDAFVLRLGAARAVRENLDGLAGEKLAALEKLAAEAEQVRDFLGLALYKRFDTYVVALARGAARGRAATDICANDDVFREFASDVRSFSKGYQKPSFGKDRRSLIKLRAFFEAKLPE
ncbi:MAG: DUF1232 domain-containing protein [Deltaproteobacteria bacterium]|nr:DUF1232 domain-containing protein [Deltaproteobacteria bacterium]